MDGQSLGGETRGTKVEVQEGGGGVGVRDTERISVSSWNGPRCSISSASRNQLVLGAGAFDRFFTEDGFIGHFSTKTKIAL